MGALGWPPSEFWRATPHDLFAALDGWREARGVKRGPAALSGDDIATFRAKLDAARRRDVSRERQ